MPCLFRLELGRAFAERSIHAYHCCVRRVEELMNILRKEDLASGLAFIDGTGPVVAIPTFLPHLTEKENRDRTRGVSGEVGVASRHGKVFTGQWDGGSQDAFIAVWVSQTKQERRAGTVPTIVQTWVDNIGVSYHLFRTATGSLLYVPNNGPSEECRVEENRIVLPNLRTFVIEASYVYPGFFGAWSLKAGVESKDPRVWDHLL